MRVLLTIAISVLLLAGCAPAEVEEAPVAKPPVRLEPTPTQAPTPEFEVLDPNSFFVDGKLPEAWGAWESQDVNFIAPSGKIGCAILGAEHEDLWGCAAVEGLLHFERDDPNDFCFEAQIPCGDGIEVSGADIPHPRLRGDPGFPAGIAIYATEPGAIRTLELGQSVTFGSVTCYSEAVGISCKHAVSRHGFRISEESWEMF